MSEPLPTTRRSSARYLIVGGMLLLLLAGGWWGWRQWWLRDWPRQVQRAFVAHRYTDIEQLARRRVAYGPIPDASLGIVAQSAIQDQRFEDALHWLETIPDTSPLALEARAQAAEILLLRLHRMTPAEERLREVLRRYPEHVLARQQFAGLQGMLGNTRVAGEQRVELLRRRIATPLDLILMGLRDTALENADWLQDFVRDAPDDPLTLLAQGHADYLNHKLEAAETGLRRAMELNPRLLEARLWLGRILLDQERWGNLSVWREQLPAEALQQPEFWVVLGDWARERGETHGALRCYLEAVQRDSLQHQACLQIGQLLQAEQRLREAQPFLKRAELLQDHLLAVKRFNTIKDHTPLRTLVERSEALGMLWEASGWAQVAQQMLPNESWPMQATRRLQPQLRPDLTRVIPKANPVTRKLLDEWPFPDWSRMKSTTSTSDALAATDSGIRFEDIAEQIGLNFDYENGHSEAFGGRRVFEFAGGGVGVVDYDLDWWPDLVFTQGTTWPPQPGQRTHLDRLFRNRSGKQAEDVTLRARLFEDRYSQGIAVGDFNQDGFPDLFVGNVGRNRLYVNLGDGTFSDTTEEAGLHDDWWTTSTVMADLSGDGLPDLYAVNYLTSPDLVNRLCLQTNGQPRTCSPHDLDPAPDEFYLNLGDGRFREATREFGLQATRGKGLGAIVADFEGTGRLGLFVGNDTDGNLYFRAENTASQPRFEEASVISGLAYNEAGLSMASMGIAAGDANQDGLLDLFITNYFAEANTLYVQQPGGFFQDLIQPAGLREPSLNLLGFGTQFLDADLDGLQDLVLVNGHVDDETHRGIPYRMRPQFFRNLGQGRFQELFAAEVGPWFGRETLGRGLARLDWNRDGREDFVVSHQMHPAALLLNISRSSGSPHSLRVRLIDTTGDRDAVGASASLTTGKRVLMRQITAGDGYLASNQRQLIFGYLDDELPLKLVVRWLDGTQQTVVAPKLNQEFNLITRTVQ